VAYHWVDSGAPRYIKARHLLFAQPIILQSTLEGQNHLFSETWQKLLVNYQVILMIVLLCVSGGVKLQVQGRLEDAGHVDWGGAGSRRNLKMPASSQITHVSI